MRKTVTTGTEQAMTWPVQVSNGSLLCGRMAGDGEDEWYCWARLMEAPDDPGEFTEFSPAKLAAVIIAHGREFHTQQ